MQQLLNISKDQLKEMIINNIKLLSRKNFNEASEQEVYQGLVLTIRELITDKWIATHDTYKKEDAKIIYYLSMEFLMGRFLGNMMINFKIDNIVREVLEELSIDYNLVEEQESDPGLGNGGLGRLAACFLDSLSTLQYPAYGCGIKYNYGIFKQDIIDGNQVEKPDNWLKYGDAWGIRREEYSVEIKFYGYIRSILKSNGDYKYIHENYESVIATPYDYPIVGYNNTTVNTLRLWEADAKGEFDLQSFNEGNYMKSVEEETLARKISNVLYPADEFEAGKTLRLKQQYFFVSATLQTVIEKFAQKHDDFTLLPEKAVFQLNDTHPAVTISELMRILIDEYELPWNKAWNITQKTCAYTNHTIMSEALEKWPIGLFQKLLPRIYMIIEEINRRFCAELIIKYGKESYKLTKMPIILNNEIHMAHLAIVGSFSVNGVAQLHSKILKEQELKDFYEFYPNKFNNKTNGITQRRWLLLCNPGLSKLITENIGDKWITDLTELNKLKIYAESIPFKEEFMKIKRSNKVALSNYIKSEMDISVDPDSIFDIQIKRLHEYKRQLLNALYILDLYNQLKANPNMEIQPRTFIFGAKAAASYKKAKLIIKLINDIAYLVNNDISIKGRIKVVFAKNYRVSLAEKLIPAADLSQQISTAGKEASGTGNMKFMLNGALTIGTMDGANVEIYEEVGKEHMFIFGLSATEVIDLYKKNIYNPWDIYNSNQNIKVVLNQLLNGTLSHSDPSLYRPIYDSLLNGYNGNRPDEYFILKDYESYTNAQKNVDCAYKNKSTWSTSAILNVASSAKFSSDRTINQYAYEIWNIKPIKINSFK